MALPAQRRPPDAQFADNDEDGDSCLNFEEFKQAMEIVAPNFGVAELKGAFHASDTDGSGGVDKDEFMKRVSMFQQMSEDMDNAGAGAGTAAPPSAASEKNLMQLTAEERKEAEMLFQKYDKDKSGELDFAEFRKARRARSLWLGAAGWGEGVCASAPWLLLPRNSPRAGARPSTGLYAGGPSVRR